MDPSPRLGLGSTHNERRIETCEPSSTSNGADTNTGILSLALSCVAAWQALLQSQSCSVHRIKYDR